MTGTTVQRGIADRLLSGLERAGNRLPQPFILFWILFAIVGVASTGMALADVQVTVPGAGHPTQVRGLLTGEGISWFFSSLVDNFIEFPPLGTVITILFAIGLAEHTGMLQATIRVVFGRAPRWALPYAIGLAGISGNVMSDASMVVIPPLSALVFKAAGRHPVAGLVGGFAATVAGYSTSIFVTSIDALFAGITSAVTDSLPQSGTPVTPVSNYYYNIVASLLLALVTAVIISRIIEPRMQRLGVPWDETREQGAENDAGRSSESTGATGGPSGSVSLDANERRGMRAATFAGLLTALVIVLLTVLPGAPLRNDTGGYLPESPLLDSVVFIVFVLFTVPALAYGWAARSLRSGTDISRFMAEAVRDLAPFIVLAFAIGQFIALFNWSGIASWIAVKGANLLGSIGLTGFAAVLLFIVLASLLNLFIVSGSSMWTLLAAVFVPLFALLGYEPGFIQAAFRIGDSATQVITPLNPFMLIFLGFLRRYQPQAGMGTVMSHTMPFVVPFWVTWVCILTVFYYLGLPFGPGLHAHL